MKDLQQILDMNRGIFPLSFFNLTQLDQSQLPTHKVISIDDYSTEKYEIVGRYRKHICRVLELSE